MTRLEQLHALRDALKKATGPSRELDAELAIAAKLPPIRHQGHWRSLYDGRCFQVNNAGVATGNEFPSPRFTASIDAAVGLVPELWALRIHVIGKKSAHAEIWADGPSGGAGFHYVNAVAATPALALCLARVQYEIAKEQP